MWPGSAGQRHVVDSVSNGMPRFLHIFLCCITVIGIPAGESPATPVTIPPAEKFLGSTWGPFPSAKTGGLVGDHGERSDPLYGTLFRQITPENAGKWGIVESVRGTLDWRGLDAMFDFAVEKNLIIKHHGFVWGMQQPDWHKSVSSAEAMQEAIDGWMRAFYQRYAQRMDRIHCIEALNEPLSQPAAYRGRIDGSGATGWDWVVYCYERARALAAESGVHPKMILNEWGVETPGKKQDQFKRICQILIERKLIEVIGLQGHFLEKTKPETLKKGLDVMAALGLPLFITEFELDIKDDQQHLAQFRALFPVLWEHPAVQGVTFWGHQEGSMWRKHGWLVTKDGKDRPAMTWLREYLAKQGYPGAAPAAK